MSERPCVQRAQHATRQRMSYNSHQVSREAGSWLRWEGVMLGQQRGSLWWTSKHGALLTRWRRMGKVFGQREQNV